MPTVIVTGASRGLGRAIARDLLRRGASVVATARSAEALATIADDPDRLAVVPGDIADSSTQLALVDRAITRFGSIDAVVNNAATLDPMARMADADLDQWTRHLTVNVTAPMVIAALALPALRQAKGRVINISSGAAVRPIPGEGAYCTAKAALNMATEVLAEEEPDITAIAVRPGVVDTAMQLAIRTDGATALPADVHQQFVDLHVEGKLLDPAVPGSAIAALALHAPASMSGRFISWDDPEVQALLA